MIRNKDSNSHIKFLAVIEIIIKNSDINHPIRVKDIQNYIYGLKYDFSLDYRLIKNYIDAYNDFFDDDKIYYEKKGKYIYYYYADSSLEIMEAKAILDLVYSSDFFTLKTKENYKKRIQEIFNYHYHSYFDKVINQHIIKNENDKTFYNELENIIEAIHKKKKISFEYNKPSLTPNRNKANIHMLAPIDTCFSNNEYYLLCQGNKDKNLCIPFRLDYINNVQIIKDSKVIFDNNQIEQFNNMLHHMTYMYSKGSTEVIELQFEQSVYSNMIDKFGKYISPRKSKEPFYTVQVRNTINSTFYSWIIGFGGKIQIIGNKEQVNKFKEFLIEQFHI